MNQEDAIWNNFKEEEIIHIQQEEDIAVKLNFTPQTKVLIWELADPVPTLPDHLLYLIADHTTRLPEVMPTYLIHLSCKSVATLPILLQCKRLVTLICPKATNLPKHLPETVQTVYCYSNFALPYLDGLLGFVCFNDRFMNFKHTDHNPYVIPIVYRITQRGNKMFKERRNEGLAIYINITAYVFNILDEYRQPFDIDELYETILLRIRAALERLIDQPQTEFDKVRNRITMKEVQQAVNLLGGLGQIHRDLQEEKAVYFR